MFTDVKGFEILSSYISLSLFSLIISGSFFILRAENYFLRALSYIFFVAF